MDGQKEGAMAQVTLRINGYAYVIGCQDGEEKHLEAMAAEVNRRIDGVRAAAGPSGEARMLVMASLLLADDLFETRARLQQLEAAEPGAAKPDPKLTRKLSRMAKRAEEIADGLEQP
ncbi:cell division protein ZapA [Rhodopila sp.]|jgi:cell division protein ZapA|uniref:cell division protein ZapA n=1 Tax=Rhodopila sp. TaxID=2480087 RepID=UPI002B50CD26|nr:cell division protein ZapA [Rhodopila sp.]HVZ08526.1 cell division protein ZapA [Rhodopila sp.]